LQGEWNVVIKFSSNPRVLQCSLTVVPLICLKVAQSLKEILGKAILKLTYSEK